MSSSDILIIGGTGRTGRILTGLLEARGMSVRALVRNAATARELLGPRTRLVEGDLRDRAVLRSAAQGCRRIIFLAAGTGDPSRGLPQEIDYGAVVNLIALLDPAVMARFVLLSSAGVTQPEHPHNCTFNSVLRWKRQAENALRGSGLPYAIVRSLGLRDRPAGEQGVRIVQGDRIAFGEDIARGDVAAFLADVMAPTMATGFAPEFQSDSLYGATCEIFNDANVAPGCWHSRHSALMSDQAGEAW